jgi:hypothetical protein
VQDEGSTIRVGSDGRRGRNLQNDFATLLCPPSSLLERLFVIVLSQSTGAGHDLISPNDIGCVGQPQVRRCSPAAYSKTRWDGDENDDDGKTMSDRLNAMELAPVDFSHRRVALQSCPYT